MRPLLAHAMAGLATFLEPRPARHKPPPRRPRCNNRSSGQLCGLPSSVGVDASGKPDRTLLRLHEYGVAGVVEPSGRVVRRGVTRQSTKLAVGRFVCHGETVGIELRRVVRDAAGFSFSRILAASGATSERVAQGRFSLAPSLILLTFKKCVGTLPNASVE
jgi:hypothetical protein